MVDRGGKGMLVGDVNDFLEYTKGYYGVTTDLTSQDLRKISAENEQTFKYKQKQKQLELERIEPLTITLTNPESSVLYFLLPEMLNGNIFGVQNDISIRLYSNSKSNNLEGLKMEIEDLASTKLRYVQIYNDHKEAFKNCDYVILFDELASINEENSEQSQFVNPYIDLAKQIDEYAKVTCKILITPFESRSDIYALVNIFSKYLKRIDARTNLIGNSMCEEMMAKSVMAHRLKINPACVKNVIFIGQSLNDSYYIDISQAKVTDFDGAVWARKGTHWLSLVNMIADKDWIHKEFIQSVHERGNNLKSV